MKMIIAGSRECGKITSSQWDYEMLIKAIDKIVQENNLVITQVISGGAKGPDIAGELWATRNNIPVESIKPDWSKGRAAGMIRNAEMAKVGDGVIALYDGQSRGTKNMMDQMKKRGLPVYMVIIQ